MFVVIILFLIGLILLGSYLRGSIDKDSPQALGWIIMILVGIGGILQFVFPLASSLDSNLSFELPEGITVEGAATILPTSPPQPTVTLELTSPTTPPSANTDPIISEKDGMTLLSVPEGDFLMGSLNNDPDAYDSEKPLHTVFLSAYRIDQTEVTNAMYRACVDTGKCDAPSSTSSYDNPDYSNHPVVYVSWDDANAYCQWAGRRLPTEAEWEKAAGGTDSRKWPWGNEPPTGELANICDTNCGNSWKDDFIDDGYAQTSPVGNYPAGASPYGALDMSGNVWEWTGDSWASNYYASSPKENPQGATSRSTKVLRVGSWNNTVRFTRVRSRHRSVPNFQGVFVGFRCAS